MPNLSNTQLSSSSSQVQPNDYDIVEQTPESSQSNELLLPAVKPTPQNDRDWSHSAQDLLDGLPRLWTRGLLYALLGLAVIAIPWASFSKVDETGTARGRLEPKGMVYRLDAPVTGEVSQIRVKEGQPVKAGQVLLELDSQIVNTQLKQAEDKLAGQQIQLSQLNILRDQLFLALTTQRQQTQAQDLEALAQIEQIEQNIGSLRTSSLLQKEEKLTQVNQAQKTFEQSKITSRLATISLNMAQKEVERFQNALQEGIVSEINLGEKQEIFQEKLKQYEQAKAEIEQSRLRLAEQQSSYERTIQQGKSEIEQAQLRLKEKQKNYQSWISSARLAVLRSEEQLKDREREITALKADIQQTKREIASLKLQLGQRKIKTPVNGIVFELAIARTGAVVQPAQKVAQIAPENAPLVLRAQMPSQESGFLRVGMPVKMKFDAYPFQDYGVVEGKLSRIAPDSTMAETPQGQVEVFEIEVTLDRTFIQSEKKSVALTAGQTATAEVIIRQRRVIDFILDPFKQLQKGGLNL